MSLHLVSSGVFPFMFLVWPIYRATALPGRLPVHYNAMSSQPASLLVIGASDLLVRLLFTQQAILDRGCGS